LTADFYCKSVVQVAATGNSGGKMTHSHRSTPTIDPRWRYQARGQGFDATNVMAYEYPLEDPSYPEVWIYTDRISYRPGDTVSFHVSSTAPSFSLEIARDGGGRGRSERFDGLEAPLTRLGPDFIAKGCGWPEGFRWTIPRDAPSGFYVATARTAAGDLGERAQEHGFFVRSAHPGREARILLVGATCTWIAYNDWGGANHYHGDKATEGIEFAPRLTVHRPWARGLIWLPEGAPRTPYTEPVSIGAIPRYPHVEFAFTRGFSKWYANAGWATYERRFAIWAENNGYHIDYASQHDLHDDPELLERYACVVFIGHDEYWSWEMREAVDRYVEGGGHVARFAGNFFWQVRLEDGGRTQVCYKSRARERDPVVGTDARRRATANWEDPLVDWTGAKTFGLNSSFGMYAHVGSQVQNSAGGFTVYRPDHWAFAGTDLGYGDILGGAGRILAYKVDGLDYTFRDGLPLPTFSDGAPETVEILAMGPAFNTEIMRGRRGEESFYHDTAAQFSRLRYRSDSIESRAKASRGSGMVVTFSRGRGQVFHAGTCEWVAGLIRRDPAVDIVTRNVLDRFITESAK
jgi:hypothetical protein